MSELKNMKPKQIYFDIKKINGVDKISLNIKSESEELMYFNLLSKPMDILKVFPSLKDKTFEVKE